MIPAAVVSPPASGPAAPSVGQEGLRFGLRLAALAVLYLAIVVAWGQRNAWPDDLLACVLTVPVSILMCRRIYRETDLGFGTDSRSGQPEQLIAALVLAAGLASGQLLLMSGGLVCLGIGWLRPSRVDVDWAEWLKMPLLFLGALPIWLDFDNGRAAFAVLLDDPVANPAYRLPLALTATQAHVLGYAGLLATITVLRGRAFWLTLPLLPLFVAAVTVFPRLYKGWAAFPSTVRLWLPWIVGAGLVALVNRLTRHLEDTDRPIATGHTVRRWFAERRHPPWIAVLVVAVVQAGPLRTSGGAHVDTPSLAGMAILVALLAFLRSRTVRGPIHSRSTAVVAGALTLTLLGEFTGIDPLRRVALGLVLIGLLSWHCFWSIRIFLAAIVATAALLGPSATTVVPRLDPASVETARLGMAAVALLALAWFVVRPLPLPGAAGYDDFGWVPPKRFALILLGLLLLFQLSSAFWPDHEMQVPGAVPIGAASESLGATEPPPASGPPLDGVDVQITSPRRIPYLVAGPDAGFRRRGWEVSGIRHFSHPLGESAGAVASRHSVKVGLLWWFEHDGMAFSSHRYARRVLWSSWHLANRDLRLVALQSTVYTDPEQLAAYARRSQWFARAPHPVTVSP